MQDAGHIINPSVPIGDKAISLCGHEFKVEVAGDSVPEDLNTCRECVDTAVAVLTEAVGMLSVITEFMAKQTDQASVLVEEFDGSAAAAILVQGDLFRMRQERKASEKAAKKAEKARRKKAVKKGVKKALAERAEQPAE